MGSRCGPGTVEREPGLDPPPVGGRVDRPGGERAPEGVGAFVHADETVPVGVRPHAADREAPVVDDGDHQQGALRAHRDHRPCGVSGAVAGLTLLAAFGVGSALIEAPDITRMGALALAAVVAGALVVALTRPVLVVTTRSGLRAEPT